MAGEMAGTRIETRDQRRRSRGGACLVATVIVVLAVAFAIAAAGVAADRFLGWFDFDPLGAFSEPEIEVNDRRAAVIQSMQSMARLETMTYTVEQVIEADKSGNRFQDLLFGDRILLIAHGQVVAGVDLEQLEPSDVRVTDEDTIVVRLPTSEIFMARLDNEQTTVYERDRGLLSRGDVELETEARKSAETAILRAACEQEILERAADEAATQVRALLEMLDFTDVTVEAEPGSCGAAQSD